MSTTSREIASQPALWDKALSLAVEVGGTLTAPGERVLAVGCGTSAFVAQSYAILRERAGFGETDAAYASELPAGRRYDRVVAITRSGTTTEVLDALRTLPAATTRVAVTAVDGQPVDGLVDERIPRLRRRGQRGPDPVPHHPPRPGPRGARRRRGSAGPRRRGRARRSAPGRPGPLRALRAPRQRLDGRPGPRG